MVPRVVWLAVLVALLLGPLLVAAVPAQVGETRGLDDFNVASHVFMLVPIALAMYMRLHLITVALVFSLVTSYVYHIYYDYDTAYGTIDVVFSSSLAALLILLAGNTMWMKPRWELLVPAMALAAIAAGLLYVPSYAGAHKCTQEKLHVMWHLNAFAASSLVLLVWFDARRRGTDVGGWRELEWLTY